MTDHDSFKINEITSKWHWKSRDIGGTSALNFLIYVDGRGFVDTVRELCGEQPSYYPPIVEKRKENHLCFRKEIQIVNESFDICRTEESVCP